MTLNYKYCAVPLCNSNSKRTPEKLFLHVPQDIERRKLWMEAARRDGTGGASNFFFCEDHFDLEDSVENLTRLRLIGGRMLIKNTAMPTKFECQNGQDDSYAPGAYIPKRQFKRKPKKRKILLDIRRPKPSSTSKPSEGKQEIKRDMNDFEIGGENYYEMVADSGNENEDMLADSENEADCCEWTSQQVHDYFARFFQPEHARTFLDQEIDGKSLLLLNRTDVVARLNLKLGPAVKIYALVKHLQERSSNVEFGWQ